MKDSDLALSLRGKPLTVLAEVGQRIIAADQRDIYKLSAHERLVLMEVIGRVWRRRSPPDRSCRV
jgi:hypothetical protein